MAGRPPLPVGTWGSISTRRVGRAMEARARFRDSDGVTRDVIRRGPTAEKARQALREALRDRAERVSDGDLTRESTIAELNAEWQKSLRLAPNSIARYEQVSRAYVVKRLGQLRIREGTTPRLDRFLTEITEDVGAASAKHCRNVLMGMWKYAVRHGAAERNVVAGTAPVTVETEDPRALTLDEVARLRDAARELELWDVRDFIEVALGTGARPGDVLALTWPQIDFTAQTVTIIEDKKGERRLVLDAPAFTMAALLARRVRQTHGTTEQLVFPSAKGTRMDPSNFRKQWRRTAAKAGLSWATPKVLRKTVATWLDQNVDTDTAASQLGHTTTTVTRRHYIEHGVEGPRVGEKLHAAFGISGGFPVSQSG